MSGPTSNTAFWTVLAKEMHNLDYRVGGGDFQLVVNDHFVNPTNLLRGDCEAAAIIPEAAIPQLRKGELELMYDGKLPFQLYKEFAPDSDGKLHVSGNNFVATEKWYDAHKDLAAKFVDLWQTGVDMWKEQKAETIRKYPQHFSVESEDDVNYMIDFVSGSERLVRRQDRPRAGLDRRRNGDLGSAEATQPGQRELPRTGCTDTPVRGHHPPVITWPGSAMPAPAPPTR